MGEEAEGEGRGRGGQSLEFFILTFHQSMTHNKPFINQ